MKTGNSAPLLLLMAILTGFYSCASIPKGATAVTPFDKEKYLGKWYEIARLDFRFERNLNNTTAQYSINDNGSIRVDNQGYNTVKGEWTQAIGKAKFVGDENTDLLWIEHDRKKQYIFIVPYETFSTGECLQYPLRSFYA